MTKGELRTRVKDALNDTTGVFWTDAQVDRSILEGAEVLAEESRAIRRSAIVPLQPGCSHYYIQSIAEDLLFPYRVWSQRDERRLTALSLKELDAYHLEWDTVTGDPEVWCPLSWDAFVIWPRTGEDGGWLRVDYVAWPEELMDDDDSWDMPEQSQDSLIHYALYDSLLKYYDVANAETNLALFLKQALPAGSRSSMRKDQAREWGRESFPALEMPSSVRS